MGAFASIPLPDSRAYLHLVTLDFEEGLKYNDGLPSLSHIVSL